MLGSKFNIGEKVVYNGTEALKIPAMVIGIDFVRGFYTIQTENRGRIVVDFEHETQIEKTDKMKERKFKVGDTITDDGYIRYHVNYVDYDANRYACSTPNGGFGFVPFSSESFWEVVEETHDDEEALIGRYERLANDYLSEFVKQTCIEDDAPFWVGGEIAGIASVADYFVDYATIRYVVDGKMSFEDFDEWYNYCVDVKMIDDSLFTPTLEQWCYGEFTRISDDRLEYMKKLKKDFEQLVQEEKEKQN